jgi:hypothetical protein
VGLLEDLVARIEAQSVKIDALASEVAELRQKVVPSREIFTLRDVAALPESPSLKVLRNNPSRQPNGGQADGYRGSQKCWTAATVENWRRQLSPRPDRGLRRAS